MYRLLLTFIFIFSLNLSFAQLEVYEIDGEGWAKGNLIEFGINSNSQIPGRVTGVNIISSDCFEDIAQISWEGNVQGLNIKRYYSVTQDGLFIQMTTFIKNLLAVLIIDLQAKYGMEALILARLKVQL